MSKDESLGNLWTTLKSARGRLRFTIAIFIIILMVGIFLEAFGNDDSPGLVQTYSWDLTSLQQGCIYSAWAGLFFSAEAEDSFGILALLALSLGALEYRRGTLTAVFGFLIVGPLASIITLLVLWPISNAGVDYVRLALLTPDSGASTACMVCLGMVLMGEKGRWRNFAILGILVILGALFYQNRVFNIDHLDGFLVGIGTGAIVNRWKRRKDRGRRPDLRNGDEP